MTPEDQPRVPESVRDAIQTHHPGIASEIEGAIKTLHKLKEIAGPGARGAHADDVVDSLQATIAATAAIAAHQTGALSVGGPTLAGTEVEPGPSRGVPNLSACTSFGRYQIVRPLGKGAMGAVYLAYDTQLHRHVALKTPLVESTSTAIERFYREARSAAQLRSPYLCPIYDVGQIAGVYYLSMAFLDGKPLARVLEEGLLKTVDDVAAVTKKIARGLQKAHDAGIIHRDLKPENVMIDRDGEPVVMDFGLAKRTSEDVQVTMAGMIIGTPGYMSPEQVNADPRKIGPATDIYSLGVMLYQMLSGRLPFQGTLTSVLSQIGSTPPPPPSGFDEGLPKDCLIERICLKMMAKSPEDRFPSMNDVVAALEQLSQNDAAPPIPAPSALSRIRTWTSGIFSSRTAAQRTIAATKERASERPSTGTLEATIEQTRHGG
jgi:serine/threonine protein kinase